MRRPVAALLAAAVTIWLVSLAAVVRASHGDAAAAAGPADAIVVLGAAQYNGRPSPVLKARLDHAVDLFRRGLAPLIVVTGGVGTGDTVSEAVVARRYLALEAVPESALAVEEAGRTSEASLRAAAVAIRARGGRRVVLVSDGFHMLRLLVIARRIGLVPFGSPAVTSPIAANRRLELGYLLAESVKAPLAFLFTRS